MAKLDGLERAKTGRAKKQALDKALRGMFGKLQARPTPDRLIGVVDQLDAADQAPTRKVRKA